jgi:SAM-dependent methyltransferase
LYSFPGGSASRSGIADGTSQAEPPHAKLWFDMQYFIAAVFFLIMVFLMSIISTSTKGAPWVPTSRAVIDTMLTMAEVKSGEVVYDLGCGDGRVLIRAAHRFGARGVGIEIDIVRFLWSRISVILLGLERKVKILRKDLFTVDLSEADVVFTFLLQDTNDRLKEKLRRELRPGTRIISNTFTFSGFPLVQVDEELNLYLYKMGMKL